MGTMVSVPWERPRGRSRACVLPSVFKEQRGDQGSPARLVTGADTVAVVPVEVLMNRNAVAPARDILSEVRAVLQEPVHALAERFEAGDDGQGRDADGGPGRVAEDEKRSSNGPELGQGQPNAASTAFGCHYTTGPVCGPRHAG